MFRRKKKEKRKKLMDENRHKVGRIHVNDDGS